MAVEDYMESEVAVAAGATAVLLSPRVRGVLRKGAVYGVAGVLKAGDVIGGAARGAVRGVRGTASYDGAGPASDLASGETPTGSPQTQAGSA